MNKKARVRATIMAALVMLSIATYFVGLYKGLTCKEAASIYIAPCMVIEVDSATHWVTLEDWNGETWCIRDDSFEAGELIIATFDDMGTTNIYDDIIVSVARHTLISIESID